jgi:hypothetical protein
VIGKTGVLTTYGHKEVPSCPIHVRCLEKTAYSITVQWFPPTMYPDNVTDYVIFATNIEEPSISLTDNSTGSSMCQGNSGQSCDTLGTVEKLMIPKLISCSDDEGCKATLTNLTNYRWYNIEVSMTVWQYILRPHCRVLLNYDRTNNLDD